ncbi:MAG: hypothetical protein CM1200mP13_05130 [Candidatus Pelagibacterales bacterium]|nr:MAG: hypothetical protein CM1200mP13_05130 [Pelagibacterales bacterium]
MQILKLRCKRWISSKFFSGMAQGNTMKAALQDIITEHFNSDMSSVDAANALADSVLANM